MLPRLYQPELGRFLQPDPKQFEAGDYNLYRYCHNDPVNKSDPTGLKLEIGFDASPEVAGHAWSWLATAIAFSDNASCYIFALMDSPNVHTITSMQGAQSDSRVERTRPDNFARAQNGKGTGSTVEIDPEKTDSPQSKLLHGLVHAWQMDKGTWTPEGPFVTDYEKQPQEIEPIRMEAELKALLSPISN